jgi:2-polyprenyl-3-methyl-5-hydroxy-6-metoxy-1,4-benzoquinol methylase
VINKGIEKKFSNLDCPICLGSTHARLTDTLRRGHGEVFQCAGCKHGFLSKTQIDDLKTYYSGEYRKEYSHNSNSTPTNAREIFEIYKNFQSERLDLIKPDLSTKSRVLEVGASSGQFITHIQGRVELIHAIEIDTDCCNFLSENIGVECDSEYLENSKFKDENYDIIAAFQVMEHVNDPISFVQSLKKVASKKAKIFIEVPNLDDSLLSTWALPGYDKFFYHSAHLHYFTESSLKLVAQKAGFSAHNIEVLYLQDYNLLNHLHWIMNDQPQKDCLFGLSEIKLRARKPEISDWLNSEFNRLNREYIKILKEQKSTSNLMLKLTNDE